MGKLLSYRAKNILIMSYLPSIPDYMFSVIKFPKLAVSLIISEVAHCLCDNYDGHYIYRGNNLFNTIIGQTTSISLHAPRLVYTPSERGYVGSLSCSDGVPVECR
jgi:hypothetical protein